jgi:thiol-disulfide isomerase/thioredoxin
MLKRRCGKCRQIGPHVEELQTTYPGVRFLKVRDLSLCNI